MTEAGTAAAPWPMAAAAAAAASAVDGVAPGAKLLRSCSDHRTERHSGSDGGCPALRS